MRIPRNSYNFCKKTHLCPNAYPDNLKQKRKCKNAHYVHGRVAEDIHSLLRFIKTMYDSDDILVIRDNKNKEVKKCINTIVYVIRHMYDELWGIYISHKQTYEEWHRR